MTDIILPLGQLRWLLDQQHVSTSNTDIVRLLRPRMVNPEWTKGRRKAAYRAALAIHRENQDLYHDVMTGRLS